MIAGINVGPYKESQKVELIFLIDVVIDQMWRCLTKLRLAARALVRDILWLTRKVARTFHHKRART